MDESIKIRIINDWRVINITGRDVAFDDALKDTRFQGFVLLAAKVAATYYEIYLIEFDLKTGKNITLHPLSCIIFRIYKNISVFSGYFVLMYLIANVHEKQKWRIKWKKKLKLSFQMLQMLKEKIPLIILETEPVTVMKRV
ncbi:hypothetical protein ABEY31_21175 [Bacillus mycoides]|uniref:hypothetical protein n=1 Tax=Bacillus mycoides TaxID=1405 RepID=UPI003D24F95F